jgi:hypothetical protein
MKMRVLGLALVSAFAIGAIAGPVAGGKPSTSGSHKIEICHVSDESGHESDYPGECIGTFPLAEKTLRVGTSAWNQLGDDECEGPNGLYRDSEDNPIDDDGHEPRDEGSLQCDENAEPTS